MVLNFQSQVAVDVSSTRLFLQKLRRALRLGRRDFNVCLVSDRTSRRLNAAYRHKPRATDVLSFPWAVEPSLQEWRRERNEFKNFLGDIVISAETARRNARVEGHSTLREIRWLILHGLLHLLGYDHETDHGEMTALELSLRERLGIDGRKSALEKRR